MTGSCGKGAPLDPHDFFINNTDYCFDTIKMLVAAEQWAQRNKLQFLWRIQAQSTPEKSSIVNVLWTCECWGPGDKDNGDDSYPRLLARKLSVDLGQCFTSGERVADDGPGRKGLRRIIEAEMAFELLGQEIARNDQP